MSARFADDSVAQVRERTNIVEVISRYISLKRSGRGHMGLCPFHGEKTPSFSVSGERGFFHCFGCGVSGDVYKFLMQIDGLTFPEALEQLAKEAGVELPRRTREPGADDARERQLRALEIAAEYFRRALWAEKSGEMARSYLLEREIREPTTHAFGLGWAPMQGLVHALEAERVSMADGEAAGLIGRSQRDSGWYDRFRSRLMFPIHDLGGRVVGFGGRLLGGDAAGQPKYLNSSESPTFHKGRLLYGLAAAREAIRKSDEAIVVEGYMDVIALAQAGLGSVVAPLGTALTADQVRLLHRFTDRIVVLFDGDDAGRAAAARSFGVFAEAGMFADGAFLPPDEDPDSLVRKKGRSAIEECLAARAPLVHHYLTTLAPRGAPLPDRQRGAVAVAELLGRTSDAIFAGFLAREAAEHFGIAESQLLARVRRPAPAARPAPAPSNAKAPSEPLTNEESLLIELLLVEPALRVRDLDRELDPWLSETATAIVARIREAGAALDPAEFFADLSREARDKVASALLTTEESAHAYGNGVQAFEDCLRQLQRRRLKEQHEELTKKINEAEQRGDEEAVARWQEEKKNLLKGASS